MEMTPLVRYKNISFENVKNFLKMYPYIIDTTTWNEAYNNFDFSKINTNKESYKKTAYQFACQVGIENKQNNYFEVNDYLFQLNDESLKEYLIFWMLVYYAPNPYVASIDEPKIIWVDICEKILESNNLEIDYYRYFHDNINSRINIDNPTNLGNPDTLKNALIEHGKFLRLKNDKRTMYIEENATSIVSDKINYIKESFPIPKLYNDKNIFFERYSFKNFHKFFPKQLEIKNTSNTKLKDIDKCRNRIIFGAPGTGKSYKLNKDIEENQLKDSFERVTFHPNYTFSQFVGTYKPVSRIKEGSDEKEIRYEFVPGPFLRVLVDSLNDESNGTPHVLIIEEINRANPAVVFGDVFQLLDRDETGKSVYSINISEEIKEYLESQQISIQQLYIPSNMYIWATMNSADQGVYPMDSAFKRRWSFEYIDIDENQENIAEKKIKLKSSKDDYKTYRWNELRIEINKVLKKAKVNEDKLLGPFFLSKTELSKTGEEFDNIFKSKVLMYLYEDILKHKKIDLFVKEIKVSDEEILQVNTLSDIMKAYDNGKVFNFSIKEIDNTILNTNKNNLINYNNKEETVVNNEYEYEEGKENFDKVAEEQASFNLE